MKNHLQNLAFTVLMIISIAACKNAGIETVSPAADGTENSGLRVAAGTTYYVDNANGSDSRSGTSQGNAWKSVSKVNSVVFQPGDRILFVAGGSWTRQLHPQGSGTSGNPISIGSYGSGKKPRINGAGVTNGAVYFYNQQYWEINDLEVTNFDPAEVNGQSLETWESNNTTKYANAARPKQVVNRAALKIGILIAAQDAGEIHHIYLNNLEVHGVNGYINQADENSKYNGGMCFRITGTATPTWFNDILVNNCSIHDVDRTGLWSESTWADRTLTVNTNWKPSLNVVFKNNTFSNTGANAMIIRVADGPLMEHNVFDHCVIKASGNAAFNFNTDNAVWQFNESRYTKANVDDDDAGGIDSDYKTKNTIIQYNYIHDNDYGILITGGPGRFNDNTIIRYNLFIKDGKYSHPVDGKFMLKLSGNATNTSIYNNVVDIGPSQTNTKMVRFHDWAGWPSNTNFYNNIFDNSGTGTTYSFGGSTGNVFDYNSFYKNQAAGQPVQVHPIAGDIRFVNAGIPDPNGFKLKAGSAGLLSGKVISGNGGKDYFGDTVSASSAPNIGAYNGPGL
ncbi:right-handed parallel beta-helix repeat-containing protein [Dyadobacter sandarakinus]|uniref:Right-handed parallel beta-helix repeat-containing protein n=1 Tax=Dyadobacter sandarakinus TaxID=2747268 RepID=A0ABX7I8K5_9BACT|nr:right-handed parallel beta-helix repeat-containing protein [Dyadobacter sandarakinus]QRR02447.1 right-handed parallel beta-helix repeat-containing protein [Dyadobacter sandarakinus]